MCDRSAGWLQWTEASQPRSLPLTVAADAKLLLLGTRKGKGLAFVGHLKLTAKGMVLGEGRVPHAM